MRPGVLSWLTRALLAAALAVALPSAHALLLLTSTADKLQLVTSAAVTVDVNASYIDKDGATFTPGRLNSAISTATTTDIVLSPGSGVQRNVKGITIRNRHASDPVTVILQHTDGTTVAQKYRATLDANQTVQCTDEAGCMRYDATGAPIRSWESSTRRSSGSTTSGTAGTVIAEIIAGAGKKLAAWECMGAQTSATNTTMRAVVTYTDSTTTNGTTTTASTAATLMVNAGGQQHTDGGAHSTITAFDNKEVAAIRLETQGTGTGTRSGVCSAIEVPL